MPDKNYQGMIIKLAYKYSLTSLIEMEDLISEGYICLYEAKGQFDPAKGNFPTFLYIKISNRFRTLSNRQKIKVELVPEHIEGKILPPEYYLEFMETIRRLSEGARSVIHAIFGTNKIVKTGTESRAKIRGNVKAYLLESGYTHQSSWEIIRELKKEFS